MIGRVDGTQRESWTGINVSGSGLVMCSFADSSLEQLRGNNCCSFFGCNRQMYTNVQSPLLKHCTLCRDALSLYSQERADVGTLDQFLVR